MRSSDDKYCSDPRRGALEDYPGWSGIGTKVHIASSPLFAIFEGSGSGGLTLAEVSTRRLLWWLLEGTRGGPTRVKILRAITAKPLNAHQLAKELGMDYTTIRHHLDILVRHHVVEAVGEEYGAVFYVSGWLSKGEVMGEILDENRKK